MLIPNLRMKITCVVLLVVILLSLTACDTLEEENMDIQKPQTATTESREETTAITEIDVPLNTEMTFIVTEPTVVETESTVMTVPAATECPHEYISTTSAPTCTKDGHIIRTCSFCGDSYTKNKVKATGHNWGGWETTKKPTTEAEGRKQRTCKNCEKVDTCKIDKLPKSSKPTCEKFIGTIGKYNAHNLAYEDWKGDTEQAAFIEVYTVEKIDKVLKDLAKEFEKVYGFAPDLDNKYHATSSCENVGVFKVDGYKEPQTVHHYTIIDKTYTYITNDMYKVYVQNCDDGSVWVGYCIYGSMDTVETDRSQALDKEMNAVFAKLIGVKEDELYDYEKQLQLSISCISVAGTVRSIHSYGLVDVLYIYCKGFPLSEQYP